MVIKLARDIGLDQASLRSIDTSDPARFDWEEYALRESLIRYWSTSHLSSNADMIR
jgi:hypothetical protein